MIRDVIRQLFTEADNRTHDIYSYLAVGSIVVGLSLNIYAVIKGQPFDMQTFGIGTGALFAGVGVALGLKKESSNEDKS
jgi:hypothetical protein